jgi:hypothetical protein
MQFGGPIQSATIAGYATIYVQFPMPHGTTDEGFTGTMYLDDIQLTPP